MCLRVQLLLVTLCSILVFFSSNPSAATISLLLAIPHSAAVLWVAPAPGLRRPAPDRPPLPCVFWKVKKRESNQKKGKQRRKAHHKKIGCLILADLGSLLRERVSFFYRTTPTLPEKVCVVTCSFVLFCSYNQFVSFSEKREKKPEKKEKKGQRRKQAAYPFSDFLCYPPTNLAPTLHFVSSSFAQV